MIPLAVRATFGFANPNAAGALLALLALAVWLLPGKGRRVVVLKTILSATALVLLSLTASRGALIALLAGGVAIWVASGSPIPWRRWPIGLGVAVLIVSLIIVPGKLGHRLAASSPEEGSLSSRFVVYGAIPRLMVAAPGGWGLGNSASAYENWFQPLDDTRHYKNLLSTHGTWLVEFGWLGRFLYFIGWLLILLVAWRIPVSFGIWIAWGTACLFSHLGKDWILWIVPAIALLMVVCKSSDGRKLPSREAFLVLTGTALGMMILFIGLGFPRNSVRLNGALLVFGNGGEMVYYQPDTNVLGTTLGKDLRSMGGATVAMDWDALKHTKLKQIIFTGNANVPPEARLEDASIFWINPPEVLNEAQRQVMLSAKKRLFLWGELRSDANPYLLSRWAKASAVDWIFLRGSGLFVPPDKF
jgi:hypothetical protein